MTKNLNIKELTMKHPFFIILGVIAIAWFGYRFGLWLYELLH